MKITQKKILQMTRSVLRGEKRYGEHQLLHPAREWSMGLLVFLVLCVLGAWWAATVYLRYVDVSTFRREGATPETTTTYRGAQVAQALETMDDRATEYATILSFYREAPSYVDAVTIPVTEAESSIASTTDGVIEIPTITTAEVSESDVEISVPAPGEVIQDEEPESGVPTLAD